MDIGPADTEAHTEHFNKWWVSKNPSGNTAAAPGTGDAGRLTDAGVRLARPGLCYLMALAHDSLFSCASLFLFLLRAGLGCKITVWQKETTRIGGLSGLGRMVKRTSVPGWSLFVHP